MTESIAQLAGASFVRLRAFDAQAETARQQLASGGVSSELAAVLYPFDFAELLPEIITRITRLEHWDPHSKACVPWGQLEQYRVRLLNGLSASARERLSEEVQPHTPEQAENWRALITLLDAKAEAKWERPHLGLRDGFYRSSIGALAAACWFMANTSEVHSVREAHDYFLDVTKHFMLGIN